MLLKKCERSLGKLHKNRALRLARNALKSGRGSKIRTHNKGFGDPRVTITPCPYILSNKHYYTGFRVTCQYPFLQNLFPDAYINEHSVKRFGNRLFCAYVRLIFMDNCVTINI